MGSGFPQLCGDQTHAAFTFRQTEPALHFHTLAFIPVILCLVSDLTPLGTPQRRTGEPDSVLLAIVEILTVSVDLVRQNAAGIYVSKDREVYCEISFYQTNGHALGHF